jgi:hypothetical protein
MSLDVYLAGPDGNESYSANITHNLNTMASKAGIYYPLWRPDELGIVQAYRLIPLLQDGLERLLADPEYFKRFNAANWWGTYKHFCPFVENYLRACEDDPYATVSVSR